MLTKTFTSQPFKYRLPADLPPGLPNVYNPDLLTPPRIYGEEYQQGATMFVVADTLLNGYESIYLWLDNRMVNWPSYCAVIHRWNGTTGEYLGLVNASMNIFNLMCQGRDGSLWLFEYTANRLCKAHMSPTAGLTVDTGASITNEVVTTSAVLGTTYALAFRNVTTFGSLTQTVGPTTTTLVASTDYTVDMVNGEVTLLNTSPHITAGSTIKANYAYGEWVYNIAFVSEATTLNVDPETDTLLTGIGGDPRLHVWNLLEGTKRADVMLPGGATQIMVVDESRCYVMTDMGLLTLVDYEQGRVLSVLACQENQTTLGMVSWDWIFQRLLVWTYTPVDATGQNTSVINGYYARPLPVGITAPIPLRPPRKYRTTPIYTRLYGDAGEPYPGGQVTITPDSGLAVVTGFPALTDIDGESVATIIDADAGSVTLTATANI